MRPHMSQTKQVPLSAGKIQKAFASLLGSVAKREARGASWAAADGAPSPPCAFWSPVVPLPCSLLCSRVQNSSRWPSLATYTRGERRPQLSDIAEPSQKLEAAAER